MKKLFTIFYAMLFTHFIAFGQVSVGGIAFVGYNADSPDQFTIILTEYLTAGTQIYFTDAGWTGTALYANEGGILWTVPAGDLPTNTMVTFTGGVSGGFTTFIPAGVLEAGVTVSHGTVVASGVAASMNLSTSGDAILAYTGSVASPTFVACVNFNGAWLWTGASSSEQTLIPPGLTDGVNCLVLADRDNSIIDCLVLPDPATVIDYNTASNWLFNDATRYMLPPTIGTCEFLLPLTLLSFTGENVMDANQLAWITTNEINISGFEIERSINGHDFSTLAFIPANNESLAEQHYQFTDDAILVNTLYYRLKIIEHDLSFTYSAIIAITHSNNFSLQIYPNPVYENATIFIGNYSNFNASSIHLFDATGRLINSFTPEKNNTTIQFNTSDLMPGIYFIEAMVNGLPYAASFVK